VTSAKKRIAFITLNRFNSYLCDGVSNSSLELLSYLKKQGHDVAVVSFLTNEPYRQEVFRHGVESSSKGGRSSMILRGIPVHQELLPFDQTTLFDDTRVFLKTAADRIREHNVESVVTVEDDFLALFAAAALDIPGAHFFHSLAYARSFRKFPLFLKLLGKKPVFAVSEFLQKNIQEDLRVRTEVWPPLFDLERYVVERADAPAASLGFYSAGPHKGDGVVDRLARLRPDWEFMVVGRNYSSPRGEKPENLSFAGDVTDSRKFYAGIKVLLVPSLEVEGYPRVILEAAVNGIPAVANRIGGIPEAMGSSGILVDFNPGSIDEPELDRLARAYAREVEKIFRDPGLYAEFSRKARLWAEEYADAQAITSRRYYEKYFSR